MCVGDQPRISRDARMEGQHPSEKTSLRHCSLGPLARPSEAGGTNRLDRRRGRVMAVGQSERCTEFQYDKNRAG